MNEYKITYTSVEGNGTTNVIDKSSTEAEKAFKAAHKGAKITDVECVKRDVPATKQQEREALEEIRALVLSLGPNSYLATAFDGVFEDAETNIENDFAFSMKARAESATAQLEEMASDYNIAKSEAARLREQLTDAQEQIAALTKRQLPEELRRELWAMTGDEAERSRERMAEAADKMAAGADNPGCALFKDAVALYRVEKSRAETMERRAAALSALAPEQ